MGWLQQQRWFNCRGYNLVIAPCAQSALRFYLCTALGAEISHEEAFVDISWDFSWGGFCCMAVPSKISFAVTTWDPQTQKLAQQCSDQTPFLEQLCPAIFASNLYLILFISKHYRCSHSRHSSRWHWDNLFPVHLNSSPGSAFTSRWYQRVVSDEQLQECVMAESFVLLRDSVKQFKSPHVIWQTPNQQETMRIKSHAVGSRNPHNLW